MSKPDFTLVQDGELKVYQEAIDSFVNIHCHNDFSIRDALGKLDSYLDLATERNLKWFNTTNHGTLSDWARLYKGCKEKGIIPVFGVEAYINRYRLRSREDFANDLEAYKRNYHLTILVKNLEGFQNLIKIINDAHRHGFYHKPRTDLDFIRKHNKGLIGLSGCGVGEIPKAVSNGNFDRARELVREYYETFEDFYIEIPLIDYKGYGPKIAEMLIQLAEEFSLKTVITGDVHYVLKEHADSHDTLILIRDEKTIEDRAAGKAGGYEARGLHYKTYKDVKELWETQYKNEIFTPEVFSRSINTVFDLLSTIENIKFDTSLKLPKVFAGQDSNNVLLEKAIEGMRQKIPNPTKEYADRFKHEFETITKMGFADFFLLVSDLNNWCRSQNILYGTGRGSVGGSLIAYLLNVTEIDPLKYGLLFERFLDSSRKDPPDIDTDYDSEHRDSIIQYLKDKFGSDHVINIGILQTNKTRSAILDVARTFKIPAQEGFAVTKSLEGHRGTIEIDMSPLEKIEEQSTELKNFFKKYPEVRQHVLLVRNMVRNVGMHACGVCIADRNLYENIPIVAAQKNEVTAWEEGTGAAGLKDFGYIKFDLLGLNNLSIIRKTIDFINSRNEKKMSYYDIFSFPEDDKDVLKGLNKSPVGIFQFESKVAQSAIKTIGVDDFNDICAINAILRPGPLRLGMDKTYGARKHGQETYSVHPKLKSILGETFGVIIYQEQIMRIVQAVGGFNPEESNQIRRLLSKYREWENFGDPKRMKEISDWEQKFVGFASKEIGKPEADRIYKEMAAFANYGFNKSHALGYAKIAYIDLYLRHHHPVEFFSALLSSQGKGKEVGAYINDVKKFGILVRPADINNSTVQFEPFSDSEISFSLSCLDYMTTEDAKVIVQNRPYTSVSDFYHKILKANRRVVNKAKIEPLVFSGCFDTFGNRTDVYNELNRLRDKKWENQTFTDAELLEKELAAVGFSLNTNLEDRFLDLKNGLSSVRGISPLSDPPKNPTEAFGSNFFGYVTSIVKKKSKAGKEMILMGVKDETGSVNFYIWKNSFGQVKNVQKNDCILFNLSTFQDGGMCFLDKILLHFKFDAEKMNWEAAP